MNFQIKTVNLQKILQKITKLLITKLIFKKKEKNFQQNSIKKLICN